MVSPLITNFFFLSKLNFVSYEVTLLSCHVVYWSMLSSYFVLKNIPLGNIIAHNNMQVHYSTSTHIGQVISHNKPAATTPHAQTKPISLL